ncbi:phage tail protein [Eubacteriales bacterium OttesenSCG-928-A19]|nr:phage tail protein [Eubacteriales bacterium OttesenSCG-928-A19]
MSDFVTVYDQDMNILGTLENASGISYNLVHNDLYTASFSLPSDDERNALCQAHNFVSLPEDTRDIGLYRIVSMPNGDEVSQGGMKTYNLEHVIATLLDDPLFGYHEIGGTYIYTADVIRYILSFQEVKRWQLGICEFNDQFMYKFENDTLLTALLSLGDVILDPFTWDFDTSTTPWTVNLRRADTTPGCGIYYMRNMTGITKSWDASMLVTRLFLLGYGEGINQLTVKDVNGGKYYIDTDTIGKWGIKKSVFVDARIEDPRTLLARGKAIAEGLKNPYYSYTATAIDLARITKFSWDNFMPGKLVHVEDGEHGVTFEARIVSIAKGDLKGRPGEITLTIANATRDVADSINKLANRMGINELYSQGATNLFGLQFADNADATHPAIFRFYIPRECVRINKMLLSWSAAAFRAYSTGAASGGASTSTSGSGGGSQQTSSGGGGQTKTSSAAGATTLSADSRVVSLDKVTGSALGAEGGSMPNTGSSGTLYTGGGSGSTGANGTAYTSYNAHVEGSTHRHSVEGHTHSAGSHTHTVPGHTHPMYHYHMFSHSHTIPGHTHSIGNHSHTLTVDSHTHSVNIPEHSHSVTIPSHTHAILYGIYEGGRASSWSVRVDGTLVPAAQVKPTEMDLTPWLAKDADGKITRGTRHTVEIIPNSLTRIEADLFVQTFIQSVGGGDF